MKRRGWSSDVVLAAVVFTAGLAGFTACGAGDAPKAGSSPSVGLVSPQGEVAPADPVLSPTAKPGPVSLSTRTATINGVTSEIVMMDGWTLYRFEGDTNKPPTVTCDVGGCPVTWPPVLSDGSEIAISGIDRQLVGMVARRDGLKQVTLGGWPLYKFKDDKVKGDTKGEGAAGNWSAVKPDGKPVIKKTPPSPN